MQAARLPLLYTSSRHDKHRAKFACLYATTIYLLWPLPRVQQLFCFYRLRLYAEFPAPHLSTGVGRSLRPADKNNSDELSANYPVPTSRDIAEKVSVAQILNKFSVLYGSLI
jgi:hypothetical protein